MAQNNPIKVDSTATSTNRMAMRPNKLIENWTRLQQLCFVCGALCLLLFPFLPLAQSLSLGAERFNWLAVESGQFQRDFNDSDSGVTYGNVLNLWRTGLPQRWAFAPLVLLATVLFFQREKMLSLFSNAALWVLSLFTFFQIRGRLVAHESIFQPSQMPHWWREPAPPTLNWGWVVLLAGLALTSLPLILALKERKETIKAARPTSGACLACGTVNPFTLSKCYKCFAPLPWVKMPKPAASKSSRASRTPRVSLGDAASAIDWSWWLTALLSFFMPPVGLMLYFAFSRNDDDKASAAALGGLAAVAIFILRFWWVMYKATQPMTP